MHRVIGRDPPYKGLHGSCGRTRIPAALAENPAQNPSSRGYYSVYFACFRVAQRLRRSQKPLLSNDFTRAAPVSRETCAHLPETFSDTEFRKNLVQNVLDIDAARQPAERGGGVAQVFGAEFQRGEVTVEEAAQGGGAALQFAAVAGAGDGRALADVGRAARTSSVSRAMRRSSPAPVLTESGRTSPQSVARARSILLTARIRAASLPVGVAAAGRAGRVASPSQSTRSASLGALQRPADAFVLDVAAGFADARRVHQHDRKPLEIEPHFDDVAGGAGLGGDDGHVAAGERVHQARLAGIGRPGDDDRKPSRRISPPRPSARCAAISSRSAAAIARELVARPRPARRPRRRSPARPRCSPAPRSAASRQPS